MPLPPVPASGNAALDEYHKALSDALERDLYTPIAANGGLGQTQAEVDSAIQSAIQASVATLQPQIDAALAAGCPLGVIVPYSGATAPSGWLLCQGQAVAKADYPSLYGVLGGTFGQTDTHFSLPDLRGRVARGASGDLGVTEGAEVAEVPVPSHSHNYLLTDAPNTAVAELFSTTPLTVLVPPITQTATDTGLNTPAASQISLLNPAVRVNYIIRAV